MKFRKTFQSEQRVRRDLPGGAREPARAGGVKRDVEELQGGLALHGKERAGLAVVVRHAEVELRQHVLVHGLVRFEGDVGLRDRNTEWSIPVCLKRSFSCAKLMD